MKLRSGLQMPEKSTLPAGARGAAAGALGLAAFGRGAVAGTRGAPWEGTPGVPAARRPLRVPAAANAPTMAMTRNGRAKRVCITCPPARNAVWWSYDPALGRSFLQHPLDDR